MRGNDDFIGSLVTWVGHAVAITVIVLLVAWLLLGCSPRTVYVPVESRAVSVQSDTVTQFMMRLLSEQRSVREQDSFSLVERVRERTVVNERGDTTRHDTHTEVSTARVLRLETEVRELRVENDSLRRLSARVDTVPVPYRVEVPVAVERELTAWEEARLRSWPWLLVALVAVAGYAFRGPLVRLARRVISR